MHKHIEERHSKRSFDGRPLSPDHEALLQGYLSKEENLIGINGHRIEVQYVKTLATTDERIGTYGVIKNAPAYVVSICKNDPLAMVDCGYVFEKLVLYLQSLNINTCWLGGTFKRSQLNVDLGEDQFIPIISPIGYGTQKKSFGDKLTRKIAKSDQRKAFDDMFFMEKFGQIIEDSHLRDQLNYIRIGPSASNKQPWRIVMDPKGAAHFYIERTPNYGRGRLGYDIQMVDMGIALCHYEMVSGQVKFVNENPKIPLPNALTSYICSVIEKKGSHEDR